MPFVKGQSGNPKGRPPRSAKENLLRNRIAKVAPGIIERLTEQALAGDTNAAGLLLSRILPPYKPAERPTPIDVPPDLAGASEAILGAVGRGELAPGQAASLASALASLARVAELAELEQRMSDLEARLNEPRNPG
jgi:hypothetical protein